MVDYKERDKHATDVDGDKDACTKVLSIKCGRTQGIFNVV